MFMHGNTQLHNTCTPHTHTTRALLLDLQLGMKTDRIQMDIIDIIFVFIFLVGFKFKY